MRMRLGLLQDPAVIEKQIAKEVAQAEAKRKKSQIPTVLTEAETKAAEARKTKEKEEIEERTKAAQKPPRIRPLSEAKAIETGANFISEAFMFMVAGGIIVFESWRSRRKENTRREDVADRIEALESKIGDLEKELHAEQQKTAIASTASSDKGEASVEQFKEPNQPSKDSQTTSVKG
jgi:optic atrophy 3 protein